jgi:hypothetical protein
VSDETFADVVYRWHQIMFRLDELDETLATGMTEEESRSLEAEQQALRSEIASVEEKLGQAKVSGLRSGHEHDRAYDRQRRQMEAENES